MTKTAIAILILIVAVAAGMVAAGSTGAPGVTVWGTVQRVHPGTCDGLTDYVEPCPGCRLWLQWDGEPLNPGATARLSGDLVSNYGMECEVLVVHSAWVYGNVFGYR
jgi:hypothetical protein